jgi:hypothetical protein
VTCGLGYCFSGWTAARMWGLGTNMMAHGLSLSLRQLGKWGKDRNKGGGIKASFSQGGTQVFITKEQSSIYLQSRLPVRNQ